MVNVFKKLERKVRKPIHHVGRQIDRNVLRPAVRTLVTRNVQKLTSNDREDHEAEMRRIRQDQEDQQRRLDEQHREHMREMDEKNRKIKELNQLNQIQHERDRKEHQRQMQRLQERSEREFADQQRQMKAKLDAQTREDQRRLDSYKSEMTHKMEMIKLQTEQEISELTAEQAEERQRLNEQAEAQKAALQLQVATLDSEMRKMDEENKRKQKEMLKIIEKKNYESHYQIPENLKRHFARHPRAFYLQVLGCRGAGKSTFVNKLLASMGIKERAAVNAVECTLETQFFNITDKVTSKPRRYNDVFLVDQPGIGGLQITEAGYLNKYGPGHFNFTLMLGEKGFNEIDMALLKHLLFNKKPVAFVRTQCDSAIVGIQDTYETKNNGQEMSFEDALAVLRTTFGAYMEDNVMSKVTINKMDIFYIGLPTSKFGDFKKLMANILSGIFMEQVSTLEADESAI